MKTFGRRDILIRWSALGLGLVIPSSILQACSSSETKPDGGSDAGALCKVEGVDEIVAAGAGYAAGTFTHGVASGDPLVDAVILWTRFVPTGSAPDASTDPTVDPRDGSTDAASLAAGGSAGGIWEMSNTPDFARVVSAGRFETSAARDWTVKVDAKGCLEAGTTYYYRFRAGSSVSPVGRTRTAPQGDVTRLRFAVVSCSALSFGWFHAYAALAAMSDLDAVIHLGDYIYEYRDGNYGSLRGYEPSHEIVTLEDYRTRYAQYRREAPLQEMHRQHPMIAVWDDHEIANDAWKGGAENHQGNEGDYAVRKAAGEQAYFEWMPIRESEPGRVFRALPFGNLVDLVMLDTRHWGRDFPYASPNDPEILAESRTILGADQEKWLEEQILGSKAKFRLIGQQVIVAPQINLAPLFTDCWNGYPAARERFLGLLARPGVGSSVVLTGDFHSSWAFDLVREADRAGYTPGSKSVAVEMATPAVTSPGFPTTTGIQNEAWTRYFEGSKRGYVLLDVTPERVQGAWFHFEFIEVEEPVSPYFATAWSVKVEERFLREDAAAAPPPSTAPALAPG